MIVHKMYIVKHKLHIRYMPPCTNAKLDIVLAALTCVKLYSDGESCDADL